MSKQNSHSKLVHIKTEEDSVHSASNCSCSRCDLNDCFKIRNLPSSSNCSCLACKHAKACSDSNKPSSTENSKSPSDKKRSQKKEKEIKIKSKMNEIQKEIFPDIPDNESVQIDDAKYTKYSSKDVSLKKEKMNWNADKKAYEKSSTRQYIHSVAITYTPKERENSTVKLSAQIMDIPYDEVKDSLITDNKSKTKKEDEKLILSDHSVSKTVDNYENTLLPPDLNFKETEKTDEKINFIPHNLSDIIKPNILTRVKEIYNACSCKVCERVAGKSLTCYNEACTCEPCSCEKCTKLTMKPIRDDDYKPPHPGCPCVKCDRKDCRGVVKNTGDENCDCKPCDCIKCDENIVKTCTCEPCQCVECVAMRHSFPQPFIVAPVQGNFQRNLCQCEPCECDNCTHNYTAMSSSLRREIATDVTYGNCHCDSCLDDSCQMNSETCRCDIHHKVMKKPLDRTNPEYDIHRTIVSQRGELNKISNRNTIAMFALSDNTKTIANPLKNRVNCHCLECECLTCNDKPYCDIIGTKHSKTFEKHELSTDLSKCKCSNCNCEICKRSIIQNNELGTHCYEKHCDCSKCGCLICKGLIQYTKNDVNNTEITNHFMQRMRKNMTYPKKGRIFTPAMFEAIHPLPTFKTRINNDPSSVSVNRSLRNKITRHKKVTICHTESTHNNVNESDVYHKIIKFENSEILSELVPLDNRGININLGKMSGDKTFNLNRKVILSKNKDDHELKDIFHTGKRKPTSHIDLLNQYIYLTKSHSKIMLETDASNPLIETLNSKTVKNDEENNKNSKDLIQEYNNQTEISNEVSLKDIKLVDKELSKKIKNRDMMVGDNVFVQTLEYKDNFNDIYEFKTFLNTKLDKSEGTINYRKKIASNVATNTNPKQTDYNIYKRSVKFKNRQYNKMYRKFIKHTIDKTHKDVNLFNDNVQQNGVNEDVLTILENLIDSLESEISKIDNLELITKQLSSISVNNSIKTENLFIKRVDEEQDIEHNDEMKSWPIMQKNLLMNCTNNDDEVISAIPVLDYNVKNVSSLSNQITEAPTITRRGKEALAQLLIEVKNLLNSPFLLSPRSSKSIGLIQNANNTSEIHTNVTDSKYKSIYSDAISQTLRKRILVDKETNCNFLQSIESLYKNMKQIVDFVLSRAAYKSEITTTKYNLTHDSIEELPKINSAKSSCDGLKAAFVGFKTISDHTLMVKWRLPRQVEDVQGYELQVDGRPVQKILSPMRRTAVLTCLPRADRLLLTIRTLADHLPSDHSPASTIVYRPRVK